jgi:hypothetical protein
MDLNSTEKFIVMENLFPINYVLMDAIVWCFVINVTNIHLSRFWWQKLIKTFMDAHRGAQSIIFKHNTIEPLTHTNKKHSMPIFLLKNLGTYVSIIYLQFGWITGHQTWIVVFLKHATNTLLCLNRSL